jgi:hypothetical protein
VARLRCGRWRPRRTADAPTGRSGSRQRPASGLASSYEFSASSIRSHSHGEQEAGQQRALDPDRDLADVDLGLHPGPVGLRHEHLGRAVAGADRISGLRAAT